MTLTSAAPVEVPRRKHGGGFVDEMRSVAMKLHTREQARGGEKEAKGPEERSVSKWEPTIDGYLRFLVDSKLVFDTLEGIVQKAAFPCYAEFRDTGLERSENLARDLEWFKDQGHTIPEPSDPGIYYAGFLEDLSQKDPHAFVCHFYNIYFAHSAGGRMIGKKVAEKILDKRQLEFYMWDGDLPQLLQNAREKLDKVSKALGGIKLKIVRYRSDKCSHIEFSTKQQDILKWNSHISRPVSNNDCILILLRNGWTREEKDHCLAETEKSFKYSGDILRLILI